MVARSLGRLALPDSAAARGAETAIRSRLATQTTPGLLHALYTLARVRRVTGNLEPATIALLRTTAVTAPDSTARRLALATLALADGLDSATAVRAFADRDDEARRLTLRGSGPLAASLRKKLLGRALADPSMIVRVEAIAAARLGAGPPDCTPILAGTRDREPYVVLTAIDSLGSGCADRAAATTALRRLALSTATRGPPDHRWQVGAHAVLALAHLDSAAATPLLTRMMESPRAEVRQYAARAAAVVRVRPVLLRLATDQDRNVREAVITGLVATAGHEADSIYLQALGSSGNQVVLAAAEALKGSTRPETRTALLDAFDRLSAGRRENARDPRMAILERLGEVGSAADAPRLEAYLADFDTHGSNDRRDTAHGMEGNRGRSSSGPVADPRRTVGRAVPAGDASPSRHDGGLEWGRLIHRATLPRRDTSHGRQSVAARPRGLLQREGVPAGRAQLRDPGWWTRRERIRGRFDVHAG